MGPMIHSLGALHLHDRDQRAQEGMESWLKEEPCELCHSQQHDDCDSPHSSWNSIHGDQAHLHQLHNGNKSEACKMKIQGEDQQCHNYYYHFFLYIYCSGMIVVSVNGLMAREARFVMQHFAGILTTKWGNHIAR